MTNTVLDKVALGEVSADDARLDYLVNVEGINQLTASQMLWAPDLLDHEPETRRVWASTSVRRILADRLGPVLAWLGVTA